MKKLDIRHHTTTASCHYLTLNQPKICDEGRAYVDTDIVLFSYEDIVLICDDNTFYVLEGKHNATTRKHIDWFLFDNLYTELSSKDMQLKFANMMCRKSKENSK